MDRVAGPWRPGVPGWARWLIRWRWAHAGALVVLACLCLATPPVSAQPVVSFNPLSNGTVSPGQLFDFVIRIDFGTGQFLSGSISLDGVDVTSPFVAAINSGVVRTTFTGGVGTVTVPGASLTQLGPHQVVVRITATNGSSTGQWNVTVSSGPSTSPLSADQKALLDTLGKPDYFSITFNTAPDRREETWTYTTVPGMSPTTYIFHDGARVGQATPYVKAGVPQKPPRLDPSTFPRNTTLANLMARFAPPSTSFDISKGALSLKAYHFPNGGVMAWFNGTTLYQISGVDLP